MCVGIIALFGAWTANIYTQVSKIYHVMSQEWVPASCIVHGVWLDAHWRAHRCHHSHGRRRLHGCGSTYWQYHYEVSVLDRPNWPRTEACYYESCRAAEEHYEDDAALYMDRVLEHACERAGYEFDEGVFDFDDTDPTNYALEHGLNCAAHAPTSSADDAPGLSSSECVDDDAAMRAASPGQVYVIQSHFFCEFAFESHIFILRWGACERDMAETATLVAILRRWATVSKKKFVA